MAQTGDMDDDADAGTGSGEDGGVANTIAALEAVHDAVETMLRAETVTLARQLDRRFDEIAFLTRRVIALEARQTVVRHLERARATRPWLAFTLRSRPSVSRQIAVLRGSDLFDAAWYAPRNGIRGRPASWLHHVRQGAFDGVDPGPGFSTMGYYLANPDVAELGWPALVHYEMRGRAEGREIQGSAERLETENHAERLETENHAERRETENHAERREAPQAGDPS